MGIEIMDVNNNGAPDILAAGNLTATDPSTIRYDAGSGICLLGDGTGDFTSTPVPESGLNLDRNVRDLVKIRLADGKSGILVSNNNENLQLLVLQQGMK
jgi:hypothetical protein